ncbi:hypothetical protein HDU98_001100 [Podochytrium sp. JEL0797]|nr:hypothetical protein HDU98_001100 [Podochytrium sp. JEL0797]
MTTLEFPTSAAHRALMATLPQNLLIPRKAWKSHPNMGRCGMLVYMHTNFRASSKQVLDGILSLDHSSFRTSNGQSPRVLLDRFRDWQGSMNTHEYIEETYLYPYLYNKWRIDLSVLTKEHGDIHDKRDQVLASFATYLKFEKSSDDYGSDAVKKAGADLEKAMTGYVDVLKFHLAEEEELIIPMMLELSQQEYKRMM